MAIDFGSGNNDLTAATPVGGLPLTISLKFRVPDVTNDYNIFSIADSSVTDDAFWITTRGATFGDPISFSARASGVGSTAYTSGTGFSANTWHHLIAVASSATSRQIYLDTGASGSAGTSVNPSGLDTVGIGSLHRASVSYGNCILAEVAIYNYAAGAAHRAELFAGISPLESRVDKLVAYWPLMEGSGPSFDLVGGRNATWNGSPAAYPHPPQAGILLPILQFPFLTAVALPSMRGYAGYGVRPYSAPDTGGVVGGGGGGGSPIIVPGGIQFLDRQFATVIAARLGGALDS